MSRGASFDRNTAAHIPEAGLELVDARFVVDDLMQLLTVRVPGPTLAPILRGECVTKPP